MSSRGALFVSIEKTSTSGSQIVPKPCGGGVSAMSSQRALLVSNEKTSTSGSQIVPKPCGGGVSRSTSPSADSNLPRQRFYVELKEGETNVVSWKELVKNSQNNALTSAGESPADVHPSSHLVSPIERPSGADVIPVPADRIKAVVANIGRGIDRMFKGAESDEEDEYVSGDDCYDTEDSFIDDSELHGYFQGHTKEQSEYTGFYIQKRKPEKVDELSVLPLGHLPPPEHLQKKRKQNIAKQSKEIKEMGEILKEERNVNVRLTDATSKTPRPATTVAKTTGPKHTASSVKKRKLETIDELSVLPIGHVPPPEHLQQKKKQNITKKSEEMKKIGEIFKEELKVSLGLADASSETPRPITMAVKKTGPKHTGPSVKKRTLENVYELPRVPLRHLPPAGDLQETRKQTIAKNSEETKQMGEISKQELKASLGLADARSETPRLITTGVKRTGPSLVRACEQSVVPKPKDRVTSVLSKSGCPVRTSLVKACEQSAVPQPNKRVQSVPSKSGSPVNTLVKSTESSLVKACEQSAVPQPKKRVQSVPSKSGSPVSAVVKSTESSLVKTCEQSAVPQPKKRVQSVPSKSGSPVSTLLKSTESSLVKTSEQSAVPQPKKRVQSVPSKSGSPVSKLLKSTESSLVKTSEQSAVSQPKKRAKSALSKSISHTDNTTRASSDCTSTGDDVREQAKDVRPQDMEPKTINRLNTGTATCVAVVAGELDGVFDDVQNTLGSIDNGLLDSDGLQNAVFSERRKNEKTMKMDQNFRRMDESVTDKHQTDGATASMARKLPSSSRPTIVSELNKGVPQKGKLAAAVPKSLSVEEVREILAAVKYKHDEMELSKNMRTTLTKAVQPETAHRRLELKNVKEKK